MSPRTRPGLSPSGTECSTHHAGTRPACEPPNAIAERFVGTLRPECLYHLLIKDHVTSPQCYASTSSTTNRTARTDHCISIHHRQHFAPLRRSSLTLICAGRIT
jgi:hypothetical protein